MSTVGPDETVIRAPVLIGFTALLHWGLEPHVGLGLSIGLTRRCRALETNVDGRSVRYRDFSRQSSTDFALRPTKRPDHSFYQFSFLSVTERLPLKTESAREPWQIKVGMLVSYDYKYVFLSLPYLYDAADKIVLAVDKNRMTWSGQPFDLPSDFFDQVRQSDPNNKISFYEDNFSLPNLLPIENETRERTMLGEVMGTGGWHVQVDSDEYFVDFPGFCQFLHGLESNKVADVQVFAHWLTLFKKDEEGWYFVDGGHETFPVATTTPQYSKARNRFGSTVVNITVDSWVVHQSWARPEPEVRQKLAGWGHSGDFPVLSYLEFWKSINSHNACYVQDFHPLGPGYWPRLSFFEGDLPALMTFVQGKVDTDRRERDLSARLQEKIRLRRGFVWFVKGLLPPFLVVLAQRLVGLLGRQGRRVS